MKSSLKISISCLLVCLIGTAFIPSSDKEKMLMRKWKFVHLEIPEVEKLMENATSEEKLDLYEQIKYELKDSYINFKEQGRYEARVMNQGPVGGTWKLNSDETGIIVQMDSEEKSGEMEIVSLTKRELVVLGADDPTGGKVKMFLVADGN